MNGLSDFAITQRWPDANPDLLQLYSLPTPNGVKVSVMLEEVGIPYEAHRIDTTQGESRSEAFVLLPSRNRSPR